MISSWMTIDRWHIGWQLPIVIVWGISLLGEMDGTPHREPNPCFQQRMSVFNYTRRVPFRRESVCLVSAFPTSFACLLHFRITLGVKVACLLPVQNYVQCHSVKVLKISCIYGNVQIHLNLKHEIWILVHFKCKHLKSAQTVAGFEWGGHCPVHTPTLWCVEVYNADCCCIILQRMLILSHSWIQRNREVCFSIQYSKPVIIVITLSLLTSENKFESKALFCRHRESPNGHKAFPSKVGKDIAGTLCRSSEACVSPFIEKLC